jgi:tellurite resistance protein TerC
MTSIAGPWLWSIFGVVVLGMLALDLGVFHRKAHVIRLREAALWSAIWVGLALSRFGVQRGLEFFQAWLVEKALSVDNIFVFLAIFSYFAVAPQLQHRVLFWGIFGALVTRGVFIWTGAALLNRFHFVMYVFGVFLILTAGRLLIGEDVEVRPDKNLVLRLFRRILPVAREYAGTRFLVQRDGRWMVTPLLMVLIVVEATDVVFAVDSIPAVFGITQDVFIVYTSNIFAILGLRAMSFMVASAVQQLRFLKAGLALVLAFVGMKMLAGNYIHISELLSLAIVAGLLLGATLLSLFIAAPATSSQSGGQAPDPRQDRGAREHRPDEQR